MYTLHPRGIAIYGGESSGEVIIGDPIATPFTEELLRGSSCDLQFAHASAD